MNKINVHACVCLACPKLGYDEWEKTAQMHSLIKGAGPSLYVFNDLFFST